MFSFFKSIFSSIFGRMSAGLSALFKKTIVDEQTLRDLETLLIEADVGIATTKFILTKVKEQLGSGTHNGKALHDALKKVLSEMLNAPALVDSSIYVLVGVNGSGKTTAAAKLAAREKSKGKKVLLVAADTFRAAGMSQLQEWANRIEVDCVGGNPSQDPASVVYAGMQQFKTRDYDTVIIDTAGRLQTKVNLMKELEKVKKVIQTQAGTASIATYLTIDAMLGQNSLDQARLFHESAHLDGAILTKMDGTGKGGIIFALKHQIGIPVRYISFGETIDALMPFNADEFVNKILS